MKDYRRARKGEIKCRDCEHGRRPMRPGNRYRCTFRGPCSGYEPAVGEKHTCAHAEARVDTQSPAHRRRRKER
jgi:hypothetical protein